MKLPRRRLRSSPAAALAAAAALSLAAPQARAAGVCDGVAPVAASGLASFPVVTGLANRPLLVTAPPGDTLRLFVVEQTGYIRIHKRGDPPGTTTLFLDLTDRVLGNPVNNEMGLLGLAFDPEYATNGLFYVNYNSGVLGGPYFTNVSRFTRDALNPDAGNPASEEVLLRFSQPGTVHKGGQLLFGLDGFLYVATGDGGTTPPPGACGPSQDRSSLLGKILRIDVRGADPQSLAPDCGGPTGLYRVPATNPYAQTGNADCGEVVSSGLRNPWRPVFDPATGDLYIADVGELCWEEIDVVPAGSGFGQNFGWRSMEANHCFDPSAPRTCDPAAVPCGTAPPCGDPALVRPLLEYSHDIGCAVAGSLVYRGCQMPGLSGTYFYGDYCTFIRSFRYAGGVVTDQHDWTTMIDPTASLFVSLTSFGSDAQGEFYITDHDGTVLRVGPPFPDLEVSAPGAAPLLLAPGSWTWEDLGFTTMQPVARDRLYRGSPGGVFHCIANRTTASWSGDPADPAPGQSFAYVVTAVSPSGQETRPGIAGSAFLLDACN